MKVVSFIKGENLSESESELEYPPNGSNHEIQGELVNVGTLDGSKTLSIINSGNSHLNIFSNFSGSLNSEGGELKVNFNLNNDVEDN